MLFVSFLIFSLVCSLLFRNGALKGTFCQEIPLVQPQKRGGDYWQSSSSPGRGSYGGKSRGYSNEQA